MILRAPRPMVETHKAALLAWLRDRASYGQGAPTDRAIQQRLSLRSVDDALGLVQSLADDGALTIERDGLVRHLFLADPPAPRGTQPIPREMEAAARAAWPAVQTERPAPPARPAPFVIVPVTASAGPPFPPPTILPVAPVAAPPKPEEAPMPSVSKKPAGPKPDDRDRLPTIEIACSSNDHALIRERAEQDGIPLAAWTLKAVRAQLLATTPARAAPGKPRLSARVIRIANADHREFWAAISMMIELGATALAAHQGGERR